MASSAPRRRGSCSNFSSASRSRKITTTPRSNDCSKPGGSTGKGRPTRTSLTPRTRRRVGKPRRRTFRSSTLPDRFSQNSITWVTWPERALAAGALDEVRKRTRQIRKIGRRIRKKFICGADTIAQNLSASMHFRLLFSDLFARRSRRPEGKTARVQPIFFSQEIFARHSKIKFRFLLVGFSRRF